VFERLRLAALIIGGLVAGTVVLATPASAAPLSPPVSPDGANGAVGGPVSAASGSTYTMAGPDRSSLTITATSSTTYVNVDGSSANAASVKTGVFIMAEGTFSNQGKTLTADRITIGTPERGIHVYQSTRGERTGPSDGGPVGALVAGVGGQVSNVSGSTYTIGGPDGSAVTVTATSGTTYVNADGSSADATSVKPGVFIEAEGTPSNDGSGPPKTITAQRVTIGVPQHGMQVRQTTGGERTR